MNTLARTAMAAAIAGAAVLGAMANASAGADLPTVAAQDPACEWLGWRHPACAGGLFDSPVNIPQAPAMVPNVDGTLSLPGTPGAT